VSALRRWLREERAREAQEPGSTSAIHRAKVRGMQELDRRDPDMLFRAIVNVPLIVTTVDPDEPQFIFRQANWFLLTSNPRPGFRWGLQSITRNV
jgi:hypothetical protein